MAVGTVTIVRSGDIVGASRVVVADVQPTGGASYAVGGSAILASLFGLDTVERGHCDVVTQAAVVGPCAAAVLVQADGSIKLKCGIAAGNADNAGNADLSGTLVRVTVYGK